MYVHIVLYNYYIMVYNYIFHKRVLAKFATHREERKRQFSEIINARIEKFIYYVKDVKGFYYYELFEVMHSILI